MSRSTYAIERIRRDENRAVGFNKIVDGCRWTTRCSRRAAPTSLNDIAMFLQFHMNDGRLHGRSLISESALRQMRTIPFPSKDQVAGYGTGLWIWAYHLGGQDVRWLAHGGGGFGFRCQMKWLPDSGTAWSC